MRKQQTVALSSREAEYQGLAAAAQEVFFLQHFFSDLQHPQLQPTSFGEGNESATKLSINSVFHKRSKHIDVKQHFFRGAVQKDDFNILHVPTQKMAADIFTKGRCAAKLTEHRENIMDRLNPNSSRV